MSEKRRHPACISDVAKVAGVSTQTVSRVINDVSTVLPTNRAKVLAAMQSLNYRPNLAARTLKRGRFKAIGVAMYNLFATGNLRILEGISRAAEESGYSLDLFTFDSKRGATFESVLARLTSLPVDGALFVAGWLAINPPKIDLSNSMPLTIVTPQHGIPYPTIGDDSIACSQAAVDHLVQKGHRYIYHLAGPSTSISAIRRKDGWINAMRSHHLDIPDAIEGDWTADSGYRAAEHFVSKSNCTAVYASSDEMAYGLILGLHAFGKRVPEDISVIGVDDSLEGIVPNLSLTTMRIKSDEAGTLAFKKTISAIGQSPLKIDHSLLVADLIERKTVRDINSLSS